jgi:hypothetical protein
MHKKLLSVCAALAGTLALSAPAQALTTTWDAASGLLPDQVDPAWTLVDNAPADPVLNAGVLTLATTGFAQNMYYSMNGAELDFSGSAPYWLEGTVQWVSGTQAGGWYRAPIFMAMGFGNGNIAVLEIQQDALFIRNGNNSVGDYSAAFDTDGALHAYRMEVAGQGAGSLVQVFQDGNLVLSAGSVYGNGNGPVVIFGEASGISSGQSRWSHVSHNVAAVAVVPEPGSGALLLSGLGSLGWLVRKRRRA